MDDSGPNLVVTLAFPLLFLGLFYVFYILIPFGMASKRGRSGLFWFLFTLILSPVISVPTLFCLGEKRKGE